MENKSLNDMSLEQLRDYRNSLVKQYIGDYNKPHDYNKRLKDIDKLMEQKRRSLAFAQTTSSSWQEFLAR